MKVYLDNNIFIDIEEEQYSISDIKSLLNTDNLDIYYSQTHISEADEITSSNRISKIDVRLKSLSKITNNNYIEIDRETKDLVMNILTPKESMDRLKYWDQKYNIKERQKDFVNNVSQKQKEEVRTILGIDAKKLNNYNYKEILKHLETKKSEFNNMSLNDLIIYSTHLITGNEPTLADKIAATFELLDLIGYWKDCYTEKSNFARHQDSMHTFYSSKCDYFITNDKRTMHKANIIYNIYGINTKAINTKSTK